MRCVYHSSYSVSPMCITHVLLGTVVGYLHMLCCGCEANKVFCIIIDQITILDWDMLLAILEEGRAQG